jgi:hypothetical protein
MIQLTGVLLLTTTVRLLSELTSSVPRFFREPALGFGSIDATSINGGAEVESNIQ